MRPKMMTSNILLRVKLHIATPLVLLAAAIYAIVFPGEVLLALEEFGRDEEEKTGW